MSIPFLSVVQVQFEYMDSHQLNNWTWSLFTQKTYFTRETEHVFSKDKLFSVAGSVEFSSDSSVFLSLLPIIDGSASELLGRAKSRLSVWCLMGKCKLMSKFLTLATPTGSLLESYCKIEKLSQRNGPWPRPNRSVQTWNALVPPIAIKNRGCGK